VVNTVDITVITRGETRDYGYLGAPVEEWWAEPSARLNLNESEVLVQRDGDVVRALLSGIPSNRRDSKTRDIRVTLALDGLEAEPDLARRLVSACLAEDSRAELGAVLDRVVTAEVVSRLLGVADDQDIGPPLLEELLAWRHEPVAPAAARDDSWVGPVDEGAGPFMARLDEVLDGRPGVLVATHAFASPERARTVAAELDADTVLLLHRTTLREVVPLGKAEVPGRTPTSPKVLVALAAAIVLVLLWLVVQWLGRFGSS
jgi:hypothetical protein